MVMKMEKYDLTSLKKVSKAIYIISKIMEIVMIVAASFTFLVGILCTISVKKINISENYISWGKVKIVAYDAEKLAQSEVGSKVVEVVKNFFSDGSKPYIIPIYIFIGLIVLVIFVFVFHYIYKLFKNIYEKNSPFTDENISIINKLIYTSLIYICAPTLLTYLVKWIFKVPFAFSWGLLEVLLVLMLFALKYIFEYGKSLETKKK